MKKFEADVAIVKNVNEKLVNQLIETACTVGSMPSIQGENV